MPVVGAPLHGLPCFALQLPFEGVQQSWDKKFTYLDTVGRPVLVLQKSNVVPEHHKQFAVDYSFGFLGMIREPFLLVSGRLSHAATSTSS